MLAVDIIAGIAVAARADRVWDALIDRERARLWRSADFDTNWQPGSPIRITARIGFKYYQGKGTVLAAEKPSLLAYEMFLGMSGLPDVPENFSRVTLRLTPGPAGTHLSVTHSVPPSPIRRGGGFEIEPESGEKHVAHYWRTTLPLLRDLIEGRDSLAMRMAKLGDTWPAIVPERVDKAGPSGTGQPGPGSPSAG